MSAPQRNSIPAVHIDAAKQMHLLTTQSRFPAKKSPASNTSTSTSSNTPTTITPTNDTRNDNEINDQNPAIEDKNSPITNPDHIHPINKPCKCCGQIIIPSPVSSLPVIDAPSIEINNWVIITQRQPILTSSEIDNFEEILNFPVPEMIFGNNKIEIIHKNSLNKINFHLIFNSFDALKLVSKNLNNIIKVSYANDWFNSRFSKHQNSDNVKMEIYKPFDWTYSTNYNGTILISGDLSWIHDIDNKLNIPVDKLTNNNPIKFFDDMILFEDELADNGCSILNIKIRVMNDCLLLLQRFYLRVDNVKFKIIDTRYFIDFQYNDNNDNNLIIREQKIYECDYNYLLNFAKSESNDSKKLLRDINWCASKMPLVERICHHAVLLPEQE